MLSVADATVTEGNAASDNRHAELTVTLSKPADHTSFTYSTSNGTANGDDFEPLTDWKVDVPDGATSITIAVGIKEDTAFEKDETFGVTLGGFHNATDGDPSATVTIRNDDAEPKTGVGEDKPALPPARVEEKPAPTLSPPNPAWYVKAGLSQRAAQLLVNQGVRSDTVVKIADAPRRVGFDWLPFFKNQKPPTGYFDPTTTKAREKYPKEGPIRFWTISEVDAEVKKLNLSGVPVKVRYRAFDRPKVGIHKTKPGYVIGMDPLPRNQDTMVTTFADPVTVQVNYHLPGPPREPAKPKPPTRGACEDLYDELGGVRTNPFPATQAAEQLIERHKARGCGIRVDQVAGREFTFPTYSAPLMSSDKKWISFKKFVPKLPSLTLTPYSNGATQNPSFDQNWRLAAGLGPVKTNRFGLIVSDLGTKLPVSGVHLQYWLDVKSDGRKTSTLLGKGTVERDGTAEIKLEIPQEGTLRIEALGTPKTGPSLFGWTEIAAVRPSGCIRGISGWNWESDGDRSDAGQCAPAKARAAAFTSSWGQALCSMLCPLIPSLRPVLEGPGAAPQKARAVEGKPTPIKGGQAYIAQGQTALGTPLSSNPKPGVTSSGTVIATGGGNVISTDGASIISTDGSSIISTDGSSVIATGGGNVIATGGGNVIATGGGNVIATGGGNFTGQSSRLINLANGSIATGVIATGGGNAIDISKVETRMIGAAPVISTDGAGLIGQAGGNIISDNGGG